MSLKHLTTIIFFSRNMNSVWFIIWSGCYILNYWYIWFMRRKPSKTNCSKKHHLMIHLKMIYIFIYSKEFNWSRYLLRIWHLLSLYGRVLHDQIQINYCSFLKLGRKFCLTVISFNLLAAVLDRTFNSTGTEIAISKLPGH